MQFCAKCCRKSLASRDSETVSKHGSAKQQSFVEDVGAALQSRTYA